MRKIVAGFVALFAMMVLLTPATATTDTISNAATVIKDFGCRVYDGNGVLVWADASHAVITDLGNGKITCQVSGAANPTGRAVRFDETSPGKGCGTFTGVSDQWHNIISASGNVTLMCKNP